MSRAGACAALGNSGAGAAMVVMPLLYMALKQHVYGGNSLAAWQSAFYLPAAAHILVAVLTLAWGQDTPDGDLLDPKRDWYPFFEAKRKSAAARRGGSKSASSSQAKGKRKDGQDGGSSSVKFKERGTAGAFAARDDVRSSPRAPTLLLAASHLGGPSSSHSHSPFAEVPWQPRPSPQRHEMPVPPLPPAPLPPPPPPPPPQPQRSAPATWMTNAVAATAIGVVLSPSLPQRDVACMTLGDGQLSSRPQPQLQPQPQPHLAALAASPSCTPCLGDYRRSSSCTPAQVWGPVESTAAEGSSRAHNNPLQRASVLHVPGVHPSPRELRHMSAWGSLPGHRQLSRSLGGVAAAPTPELLSLQVCKAAEGVADRGGCAQEGPAAAAAAGCGLVRHQQQHQQHQQQHQQHQQQHQRHEWDLRCQQQGQALGHGEDQQQQQQHSTYTITSVEAGAGIGVGIGVGHSDLKEQRDLGQAQPRRRQHSLPHVFVARHSNDQCGWSGGDASRRGGSRTSTQTGYGVRRAAAAIDTCRTTAVHDERRRYCSRSFRSRGGYQCYTGPDEGGYVSDGSEVEAEPGRQQQHHHQQGGHSLWDVASLYLNAACNPRTLLLALNYG